MKCDKTCNCDECNKLLENETVIVFLSDGFSERKQIVVCVKCDEFGMYSRNTENLKSSEIFDNMLYA